MCRILNHRVGTQKPCHQGVVNPAVHVHQIELIEHFMAGVAFVVDLPIQIIRCRAAIGGSAFAPAVVGQFFFQIAARIGNADDAAQSVVVAPVEFAGVAARLVDLYTKPIRPVGFDGRLTIVDVSLLCSGIVGGGDCRVAIWLAVFGVFASLVNDCEQNDMPCSNKENIDQSGTFRGVYGKNTFISL